MGRHSSFNQEIFNEIIERLSGGEPLAAICRTEGFPKYRTVWDWMQENEEIAKAIACAREDGEEVIAANSRKVAKGDAGHSTGDVQRDKLIIETDLKLLAKWNPKKYGDGMTLRGDKDNPIEIGLAGALEAAVQKRLADRERETLDLPAVPVDS